MFGRKPTDTPTTPPTPAPQQQPSATAAPIRPAAPAAATPLRPEPPKPAPLGAAPRPAAAAAAPARTATTDSAPRKLIVGRDISLSGEIAACDQLVVEGTVDATLREGQRIEITESGLFRGKVEISEADIAGRFEGEIVVRGRLRVRSTGRIDGKISYGELEVEAGGHLEGQVSGLARPRAAAPAQAPQRAENQSTLDMQPAS
jgi:cytoskeletal protein CcmA (bactofilin family)